MPWVHISQETDKNPTIHTWSFLSNADPNSNNGTSVSTPLSSSSNMISCNFTMDIYLSLYNAEMCQTFKSGYLPGSSNDNLIAISDFQSDDNDDQLTLCTILDFEVASQYLVDKNQWTKYENACKDSGMTVAALMIVSLIFMVLTTMTVFFTMCWDHCCGTRLTNREHIPAAALAAQRKYRKGYKTRVKSVDANENSQFKKEIGRQKRRHWILRFVLPIIAFIFVPLMSAISLIVYYENCISVATPEAADADVSLEYVFTMILAPLFRSLVLF